MAKSIKITSDTSQVKKSITDLQRQLKKVSKDQNPVSIFDKRERDFIKTELSDSLKRMNTEFSKGKQIISDLIKEQKSLTRNSDKELKLRKKILSEMKDQAKLSKQMADTKSTLGDAGGGGGGKGMLGGIGGILKKLALGAVARTAFLGFKANSQFVDSSADRIRAQGLGMSPDSINEGSSGELARAGMSRRQFIQSRIQATALGSQEAGSTQSTLQRGSFERTMGLNTGQMTDVMSMLRPSLGGDEADATQQKLQASIFASGIEDAVGPHLEAMVGLLSEINETGLTQTDQLINAFANLGATGSRSPEQLAAQFGGVNESLKGASGERNALLQTAFNDAGIGNGTIGGTRFALESGGLMGMDRSEFESRGYSPDMMDTMGGMGLFGGAGEGGGLSERAGGLLDMARSFGNMDEGDSFGDMTDPNQIVSMANFSNSMFGTEGAGGLDTLKVLEDMKAGDMTQEMGAEKLKEIRAGKTPDSDRLDKINESLAGNTQILRNVWESELEILGAKIVVGTNKLVNIETGLISMTASVAQGFTDVVSAIRGDVGETFNALSDPDAPLPKSAQNDSPLLIGNMMEATGNFFGVSSGDSPAGGTTVSGSRNRNNQTPEESFSDGVERGTLKALERHEKRKRADTQKNSSRTNININLADGGVQNSTLTR